MLKALVIIMVVPGIVPLSFVYLGLLLPSEASVVSAATSSWQEDLEAYSAMLPHGIAASGVATGTL